MKHTCEVKRYISMLSAVVLSAYLLIGCTRADSGTASQNASATQSSVGQSTVQGTSLAGAGSQEDQGSSASSDQTSADQASSDQTSAAQTSSDQTSAAQTDQVQSVSGQTTQNISGSTAPSASGQTSSDQTTSGQSSSVQNQADTSAQPQTDAPASAVQDENEPTVITDEQMNAEGAVSDIFSGEYTRSDGGESVTVALMDSSTISFVFANSGISASAAINGNTAVYNGDDGYSITFDFASTTLGVMTSSPDGGASTVDGIYNRVLDGGELVDDNEDVDADIYEDVDEADDFVDAS